MNREPTSPAPTLQRVEPISETAFELGAAVGIAVLGSTTSAIYRRRVVSDPEIFAGLPADAKAQASDNLTGALEASIELPVDAAHRLIGAAQVAFASGVRGAAIVAMVAMGVGAVAVAWSLRGVRVSTHAPH